uniref:Uncharacterized protein n=1 Tax=Candidatus Kentrum sp. LPFa TaxID=2126335 RepID=A0A450X1E2_9GAMM|nr:MAG: hypothetical protein BECKLPF1236B_GA0070989_13411 [Candidatus Kentron sp. LPFa]
MKIYLKFYSNLRQLTQKNYFPSCCRLFGKPVTKGELVNDEELYTVGINRYKYDAKKGKIKKDPVC